MSRLLVLLLACLVVTTTIPAAAQSTQDTCYALNGEWVAAVDLCRMQRGLFMDVEIPTEFAAYPAVQETLMTYLIDQQTQFLQSFKDTYTLDEFTVGPYSLDIRYQLFNHSETITSIRFDITDNTGGAHGNFYFRTFTFDLTDERSIPLEEVFAPGTNPWPTIAEVAQTTILERLNSMDASAAIDTDWIADGSGENIENYRSFVLTPEGITFYFPPYQVAPYAAGAFEVQISNDILSPYYNPDLFTTG
jgi:hypothetical protein